MKSSRVGLRDSLATCRTGASSDHIVVNDDFDRATEDLQAIVSGQGEHLRRDRPKVGTLLEAPEQRMVV